MKKLLYIAVLILVVSCVFTFVFNKPEFSLYVLDVGQGSATLIQTFSGENILIDGGPDAKTISELGKILPFHQRTIDVLIITHSHDDHIGGLIDVFERYDVKTVVYTAVDDNTVIYKKLLESIKKENSKIIIPKIGQEIVFPKDIKMTVLYPITSIENKKIDNPNNGSIVIDVAYQNNHVIVSGDLEAEAESELVDYWKNFFTFEEDEDIVYLAGHHGSNTSSSKKFLDFIKPDYSIISVGKKNKFGHPSLMILERLKARSKQVWRTDESGTLEVLLNNNKWLIKPFHLGFINLF